MGRNRNATRENIDGEKFFDSFSRLLLIIYNHSHINILTHT